MASLEPIAAAVGHLLPYSFPPIPWASVSASHKRRRIQDHFFFFFGTIVLGSTEIIFFLVAGAALYFVFSLRIRLITHG